MNKLNRPFLLQTTRCTSYILHLYGIILIEMFFLIFIFLESMKILFYIDFKNLDKLFKNQKFWFANEKMT